MPKVLVVRAPGTNCEIEVCQGFEATGGKPELVHIETLIRKPELLDFADIVAFPGGFSYGDDVASGRIFAIKLRERLWSPLATAANRGVPIIGICNGFQVLVQVGLLPGPLESIGSGSLVWDAQTPAPRTVGLSQNIGARYVCSWVPVSFSPESVCLWTRGLSDSYPTQHAADIHMLPVGHGEGRLTTKSADLLTVLERSGQIAVRYVDNYNGSDGAIAGLCDPTGRIFGLMPHPDRYLHWTRHPYWTRLPKSALRGDTPGLKMFRNAVEAVATVRS